MGTQPIDLSAGIVAPPAAPAAQGIDLSAGIVSGTPQPTAAPAAAPPAATPPSHPFLDKVRSAVAPVIDAGSDLATGFAKQGRATVGGLMQILGGEMEHPEAKTLAHYPGEEYAQKAASFAADHLKRGADYLNKDNDLNGAWEHIGGFGENIAELMTPEALGALGKSAEGAKALETGGKAQQLAEASKVAGVLKKYPRLASLVGLGLAAARSGAETGVQTFLKTGGDSDAAQRAAELGAGTGAALAPLAEMAGGLRKALTPESRSIEGVDLPSGRVDTPQVTPQAAKGADAYTATARAAVKPNLEAIGLSPEEVESTLSQNHDLTGLSARLQEKNGAAYDLLDAATKGKFRSLNSELNDARSNAFSGGDVSEKVEMADGTKKTVTKTAKQHYEDKQQEMDSLLDTYTGGELTPAFVGKVKDSFSQGYVLSDIGRVLDRSLDGLPGRSNVSQEQRGINGATLEKGIQQAVEKHGYDTVVKALGPGRLENLQAIAQATKTNAQRADFNKALHHVVAYLGIAGGAAAGHALGGGELGGIAGASIGYGAAMTTKDALGNVLNSVRLNPRIGRSLLFMLNKGTKPEVYGPLIGSMITQAETSRDKPGE